MASQFIRKVTLIVANASDGLDLSEFRIVFETTQSDTQTLNTMKARVYNLSDDTVKNIQKEYTDVTLQAGYEGGSQAVIFQGSIKQTKRGRENPTETFLDIFAADGDTFYIFGAVNKTLSAGWKQDEVVQSIADAAAVDLGTVKFASQLNPAPRGKVMYGMARDQLRKVSNSTQTFWSIQKGQITVIPITSYLDGQAVVLNSASGLIGLPEQTEDGLSVTCLLNPKIEPGTQIQVDQEVIQRGSIPNDKIWLVNDKSALDKVNFFPPLSDDGFYKVFSAEHRGDTRGNEYYTDIIALAIDKSAPQDKSVKAQG